MPRTHKMKRVEQHRERHAFFVLTACILHTCRIVVKHRPHDPVPHSPLGNSITYPRR